MTPVPMRLVAALSAVLIVLATLSTPALARPGVSRHYCEAENGVVLIQRGTARCSAGAGSYARAEGKYAEAHAGSDGSATAIGKGSTALAHIGNALVIGDNSLARAVDAGSAAEVEGHNSTATAVGGGTAKVFGHNSDATAGGPGSEAFAIGDNSSATASGCSITSGPGETRSCP